MASVSQAFQDNALSVGLIAATSAAVYFYQAWQSDKQRKELIKSVKGPMKKNGNDARYPHGYSGQPASDLKDHLLYSSVGSKNITFEKSYIGARGMRVW